MDDDTWQQWSAFLERIAAHPLFRRVHSTSTGTFDKDFQDLVSKLVQDSERKSPKKSQPQAGL